MVISMLEIPGLRRETRYGVPSADLVLYNRDYVLGYSYYTRQAKWALEIVDQRKENVRRFNTYRPDYRIPEMFRADEADYVNSGYDRGHLVASANALDNQLENSETFLLSNMCPQVPAFNSNIWGDLEEAVRVLDREDDILETQVISGPIFDFREPIQTIGSTEEGGVTLPIPHAFFKSVLSEKRTGTLLMWSFMLKNEPSNEDLETFRVPTITVERYAGIKIWGRLVGEYIERKKRRRHQMWDY